MRKPLVVVCVTASAVLLAGAIAATTAGAETTPDEPVAGVAGLPDLPGIPQLPVDPDEPDAGSGGEAPAERPGVPGGLNLPDFDGPAAGAPAAEVPAGEDPADGPPRPGGAAAGAPAATTDERPQSRPAQTQAQTQADEPKQQSQQSVKAAAKRDVTPGMVSGSTAGPVQQQVLTLVNENRRRGGCDNLTSDRRLIAAANRHAADMARHDYFAHDSMNGEGAGDRVQDAGYRWKRYGENIARGQDNAAEVVNGWMHSPEHRENIMDCRLEQMGIGLAFANDRTPYWVQDFATPH